MLPLLIWLWSQCSFFRKVTQAQYKHCSPWALIYMQEIQKEDQVGLHFTVYFTTCHLFIRTQCENMFYGLQLYIWHALGSMWTPSGSCYNWDSKILKTIQAIQHDSMPKNLTLKKCLKVLKCNNCVKWIKHRFEWILSKSGDTKLQNKCFLWKSCSITVNLCLFIWRGWHETLNINLASQLFW